MKSSSFEKHDVIIKTLTPLHISNGKNYHTYLIHNNKKLSFDDILEKAINEMGHSIESLDIPEIIKKYREKALVEYEFDYVDEKIYEIGIKKVDEFIKTVDVDKKIHPLFPGSSLKGFIVTCLLNKYWYSIPKQVKNGMRNIISKMYNKILLEKTKEEFLQLLPEKSKNHTFFNPIILVQDEIIDSKLQVRVVKVGKLEIPVEVVPENVSIKTTISLKNVRDTFNIDINEIFSELRNFGLNYLNKILNSAKIYNQKETYDFIHQLKEKYEKGKEKTLIPLGRFAGKYSKTVIHIKNKKIPKVKTIDNKPVGLCEISLKN